MSAIQDQITSTIESFLDRMVEENFVDGFESSIVQNLGRELAQTCNIDWADWWRDNCMIEIIHNSRQNEKVLAKWFDGDKALFDRYIAQAQWSRENSKFEMPSWGTAGT